ncbi:sideroflexin-4 [Pelobates fuscus]|uniref:sideroflexin-4 n=1 Tax=Pelobates fuscus TaxID=191477 RepID=UPI002FE4AF1C
MCQASLHPDTGNITPTMFRPPAFMPVTMPLVIAASLPHRGPISAFICQTLFHSYCAGFNLLNGNKTLNEEKSSPPALLIAGSVVYTACVGATPLFIMKRYKLTSPAFQTFFLKVLPAPLLAALSALNVVAARFPETEDGIEVIEKSGKVVGVSRQAGKKAVMETAVSRAALMGVTVLTPILLDAIMKGYRMLLSPIKHIAAVLVFGTLVPASFSVFPQKGKIARTDLEKELQTGTTASELYYHRGL